MVKKVKNLVKTVKDVSDELGIEIIVRTSKTKTKWLSPIWLPRNEKGILFLDELNLAPLHIQANCYQFFI